MAEINSTGYQSIRDFIQTTWTFIELRDGAGTPVLRLSTSDPRVSWTHAAGFQTLELTVTITGADVEITVPQEFGQSALFKNGTDATPFSVESFKTFTMENTLDELTIKHQIEVPQVI